MHAVLDDFAEAVVPRRDDRQAGGQRFEAGVGKRIVAGRQAGKYRRRHRARADREPRRGAAHDAAVDLAARGRARRRTGENFRLTNRRRRCAWRKPFAFPARADKKNGDLVVAQPQDFAPHRPRLGVGRENPPAARHWARRRSAPRDSGKIASPRRFTIWELAMTRRAPPLKSARSSSSASVCLALKRRSQRRKTDEAASRRSQPGLVNPVARAVNIALPDALETQEQVAMFARPDLFQLIGKTMRRFAAQAGDRPPGPFARGPGGVGKEPGGLAGFAASRAARRFK